MRFLFTLLLALTVSVLLGLILKVDNGYVLIGYGPWMVEGSLAFFLLLDLLLFGFLYLLLRSLVRLRALPAVVKNWRQTREKKIAAEELNRGLLELSEGNWKLAERRLIRHANHSETPLLNYLSAARSAQQQGELTRRDEYLQMAHDIMPKADVAVGLTQAELQLENEQYEQALTTLIHLRNIAPHHAEVLRLLKRLYQRCSDWQQLQELLPELRKNSVVDSDELQQLELSIYITLLDEAKTTDETERLICTWNQIPLAIRRLEPMIDRYASYLKARGEEVEAERVLRKAIDDQWSDRLVEIYGQLNLPDLKTQLTTAEGWLEHQRSNPVLLLTLGRLSLRNSLWGKARSYLEASIGVSPLIDTYHELGALLEIMNEPEEALASYREGLRFASGSAPIVKPDAGVKQPLTNNTMIDKLHPRIIT